MKYLICAPLIVATFILFSCGENQSEKKPYSKYKKIDWQASDKNRRVKERGERVYQLIIDSCMVADRMALEETEITPKMYQLIRYSNFNSTCQQLQENVGTIDKSQLAGMLASKDGLLYVLRYKLETQLIPMPLEFRITLTNERKLTEYRLYEWNDKFEEDLIKMSWF
ncbi:MAG: hypothetical protein AAFZ15_10320 [Bacteroidota bacterium]